MLPWADYRPGQLFCMKLTIYKLNYRWKSTSICWRAQSTGVKRFFIIHI